MPSRSHPPVVVIGLDACDADLVERWSREGRLPVLTSMREAGVWARLLSTGGLFSDSVWPSFAAGVSPAKHGFYNTQHLVRGSTRIVTRRASYGRFPPFWSGIRERGKRVAVFDVPKTGVFEGVDGIQVASWGEHYGLYRRSSLPRELVRSLDAKFGRYRHAGEIVVPTRASQEVGIYDSISAQIEKKVRAAEYLLEQESWDLFVSVFAESHYGGHQFLHRFDGSHWAHGSRLAHPELDESLPRIYAQLDTAVGEFCARLPRDAVVFVVSVHGIETNYSANHLIPPVLEGLGFQAPAFERGPAQPQERKEIVGLLRGLVPEGLRDALNRHLLPQSIQDRLFSRMFGSRIDWKRSRAFALPSGDFQGFVSINLAGREPWGVVAPGAEYREECERIRHELKRLVNPATGRPAIRDVVATAGVYEGEQRDELADLVILWSKEAPIESLHHPDLGLVERSHAPLRRSQHAPEGFLIAKGPHLARGARVAEASILDLAPTILHLMGEPVPSDADGRVLLEILEEDFKADRAVTFEERPPVAPEELPH